MASPERDKWLDAQSEELNSFKLNDVYEEVPIPEGVKPITSKHVFSLKEDAQGNIERYKVRIVARGFTQQEGVDYQDTFAPVASLESIRIILALAVRLGLYTDQMDVNTAYLNGELLQTLYIEPRASFLKHRPQDATDVDPSAWKSFRNVFFPTIHHGLEYDEGDAQPHRGCDDTLT